MRNRREVDDLLGVVLEAHAQRMRRDLPELHDPMDCVHHRYLRGSIRVGGCPD
jgi:hypothetical protein